MKKDEKVFRRSVTLAKKHLVQTCTYTVEQKIRAIGH